MSVAMGIVLHDFRYIRANRLKSAGRLENRKILLKVCICVLLLGTS